jgi:hypothetical protein
MKDDSDMGRSTLPDAKAFKYKRLRSIVGSVLFGIGSVIFVPVMTAVWGNSVSRELPFLAVYALFILYKSVTLLSGASDIVVDDESISRRLYGWVWKRMRWDNISRIKSFEVYVEADGVRSTAYNIFPIVKDRLRLFPSGKIAFRSTVDGIDELLEIINKHAYEHHVLLQTKIDGKVITVSQLTYTSSNPRKTRVG